jgi:hypothetical protein
MASGSRPGRHALKPLPLDFLLDQWERALAEIEYALGLGGRLQGPLAHLQTPTPDPSPQGGGAP